MIKRYKLQKNNIVLSHEYTMDNHFQIGFDSCPFTTSGDIFFTNYTKKATIISDLFAEIKNILHNLPKACIIYTGTALNRTLIKIVQENHLKIQVIDITLDSQNIICSVQTNKSIKVSEEYVEKMLRKFPMFTFNDIFYKVIPTMLGVENLIVDEPIIEILRFTPLIQKGFQPYNWSILEKKSQWNFWIWCLSQKIPCYPSILRFNPNIIKSTLEIFPWGNFKENMISELNRFAGTDENMHIRGIQKNFKNVIEEEKFWTLPLFRLESYLHDKKIDKTEYFFG